MNEIIVILIIMVIAALAWHVIYIRERALHAAKQHCQKMNVQFLDGSVSPNGYGLARNKQGVINITQRFLFEFTSTGERRYTGSISYVGSQLSHLELEPHIMQDNEEHSEDITHDNTFH
ncbi:MAG: DUF3301 domain-containing protein [Cellvibrionaceae bacterium]